MPLNLLQVHLQNIQEYSKENVLCLKTKVKACQLVLVSKRNVNKIIEKMSNVTFFY